MGVLGVLQYIVWALWYLKNKIFTDPNNRSQNRTKKLFWAKLKKKLSLKIRLSIRVRNFVPLNEPLNITKKLYFSPKVAHPERLNGVKIIKIQAIENLTLGHLIDALSQRPRKNLSKVKNPDVKTKNLVRLYIQISLGKSSI
jgi:hypothetical protein